MTKLLLTTVFFAATAFFGLAQNQQQEFLAKENLESKEGSSIQSNSKILQRGPGSVIYHFDFASGLPTGWSNSGNPTGALWEYRGPGTNPSNTTGSRGAWSAGTGPIQSSSAGNGFMIFDSDYLDNGGNPTAPGTGTAPSPHTGQLITDVLDFSSNPAVTFLCESYMRQFASAAWVLLSYDGGATYADTILLHEDIDVNDASENAESIKINMSQYLGGKSNVVVSFMLDGTNPLNANTNGDGYYFWQLDDISFIETPGSDIVLRDWTVLHGDKLGKHGTTPINEVKPVTYRADILNDGFFETTDLHLDVDYGHPNGTVATLSPFAPVFPTLADTILDAAPSTPTDTGLYQIEMFADHDSIIKEYNLNDNYAYHEFRVSDSTYALDHGVISSYLGTNSFNGGEDGFQILNIYEFDNAYQLNSVWARLSSLTRPGGQVYVVVYDSTGATFGGGGQFANQANPLFKSSVYTITVADSIKGYCKIPVSFSIPPGGYYVGLEMYSFGGNNTIRIAIDESIVQSPRASLIYILNNGLYTNPEAALLRLNESTANDPCNQTNISITATIDDTVSVQPYGKIENVQVTGGTPPYFYNWSNNLIGYTSNIANISDILVKGDYTLQVTDANGCTGSETFVVDGNVSVEEQLNEEIQIFPNPTNGHINISIPSDQQFNLEVLNLQGQVVVLDQSVSTGSIIQLDLSEQRSGLYTIKITSDHINKTVKLLKQ